MKKSRIARRIAAVESPGVRSLPLVERLVDTKAELFELMVPSDLRVLDAMLEEDRTALCGPRYAHQPARAAATGGRSRCSVAPAPPCHRTRSIRPHRSSRLPAAPPHSASLSRPPERMWVLAPVTVDR